MLKMSKVLLIKMLFCSSISFCNTAQNMRIKGGEVIADFGEFLLKFVFSKKATKNDKIFTVDLTLTT